MFSMMRDKLGQKVPRDQRGFGAGVKLPPSEGVALEGIQQLLAQQSATIMEAQ